VALLSSQADALFVRRSERGRRCLPRGGLYSQDRYFLCQFRFLPLYYGARRVHRKMKFELFFQNMHSPRRLQKTERELLSAQDGRRRTTADRHRGMSSTAAVRVLHELKRWRTNEATESSKPSYSVFGNSTLVEIAEKMPSSIHELRLIKGIGPKKVTEYGQNVLAIVDRHRTPGGGGGGGGGGDGKPQSLYPKP